MIYTKENRKLTRVVSNILRDKGWKITITPGKGITVQLVDYDSRRLSLPDLNYWMNLQNPSVEFQCIYLKATDAYSLAYVASEINTKVYGNIFSMMQQCLSDENLPKDLAEVYFTKILNKMKSYDKPASLRIFGL